MAQDEHDPEQDGPLLLFLAEVLAKPQRVLASSTLGRNIPLKGLIYGGLGAFIGLLLALVVHMFLHSMLILGWVVGLSALIGAAVANSTPLRGERFGTWLRLFIASKFGRVELNGERCRLYLDVAPIKQLEQGEYLLQSATVKVAPGAVDRRGLFVD